MWSALPILLRIRDPVRRREYASLLSRQIRCPSMIRIFEMIARDPKLYLIALGVAAAVIFVGRWQWKRSFKKEAKIKRRPDRDW